MNIHIAQNLSATAEKKWIMSIDQNIITPQSARPVLGLVQDCMSSIFELCKSGVCFRESQAMALYTHLAYAQKPFIRKPLTTGAEMFSYLLPKYLNYNQYGVVIQKGVLVHAADGMTSKVLGTSSNGLIHALSRYPVDDNAYVADSLRATQNFISDAQRLGLAFFEIRGFTVGITDMLTSNDEQKQFVSYLQDGRKNAIIEASSNTRYIVQESQKELNILARLDKATSDAGALAQNLLPSNNVNIMLQSGSKGKPSNIMQMSACVGQQIISGNNGFVILIIQD